MHDVLLAKQIFDELIKIAKDRKFDKIKSVKLEIGSVAFSHNDTNDTEKHIEEINPGNIQFILESLAPKNGLGEVKFDIKKIPGDSWKILEIETN